jgi:uncharacterized protein (DUF488 family)
MIQLFTIGFAGKTAERFFTLLRDNSVRKIIDTRLHPASQLSGFAKSVDLKFFAAALAGISYEHRQDFAPTEEILAAFRKKEIAWSEYEKRYVQILHSRIVLVDRESLHHACLLCAEHSPDKCHRRLLAEYLADQHPEMEIIHLM